jgi:hypothetical protein
MAMLLRDVPLRDLRPPCAMTLPCSSFGSSGNGMSDGHSVPFLNSRCGETSVNGGKMGEIPLIKSIRLGTTGCGGNF